MHSDKNKFWKSIKNFRNNKKNDLTNSDNFNLNEYASFFERLSQVDALHGSTMDIHYDCLFFSTYMTLSGISNDSD